MYTYPNILTFSPGRSMREELYPTAYNFSAVYKNFVIFVIIKIFNGFIQIHGVNVIASALYEEVA